MKTNPTLMLDDFGNYCSEVRKLPLGDNANALVGKASYAIEMQGRRERNDLRGCPSWESLEIYFKDGEYKA